MISIQFSLNDKEYSVFKEKGKELLKSKAIINNSDYAVAKHLIIRAIITTK